MYMRDLSGGEPYGHLLFDAPSLVMLVHHEDDRVRANLHKLAFSENNFAYTTPQCIGRANEMLESQELLPGLDLMQRDDGIFLLNRYLADRIAFKIITSVFGGTEAANRSEELQTTHGVDSSGASLLLAFETDTLIKNVSPLYVVTSHPALQHAFVSFGAEHVDPTATEIRTQTSNQLNKYSES